MATVRSHYEILEVSIDADGETIKKSYRRLAVKWHPDKNPGNAQAEENFKTLGNAYEILSDYWKKQDYDRQNGFNRPGGSPSGEKSYQENPFKGWGANSYRDCDFGDFEDYFEESRRAYGTPKDEETKGEDIHAEITITLEQAASGNPFEVDLGRIYVQCWRCSGIGRRMVPGGSYPTHCTTCHGRGRVFEEKSIRMRVPVGIQTGKHIKAAGQGNAGANNAPSGHLYVEVTIEEHELFQRDEHDLFYRMPLPLITAIKGGELNIPGILKNHTIRIPAGTQTDTTFRLSGAGMPILGTSRRGDLNIRFDIEIPTKLSARQIDALEEFEYAIHPLNKPLEHEFKKHF